MRIVVVLPAPLGPRRPIPWPAPMERERSSTATRPPRNRLLKPEIVTASAPADPTTSPTGTARDRRPGGTTPAPPPSTPPAPAAEAGPGAPPPATAAGGRRGAGPGAGSA